MRGRSFTWGPVILSPANRWVGGAAGQQQLPFCALDTKSIHVGWEKASSDLLMQELPCPSRSAPSQRINAIRRQEGLAKAGRRRGGEGHDTHTHTLRTELIYCFSACPPSPAEIREISAGSVHWLCLLWPTLATVSTPGTHGSALSNFVQ